MKRHAIRLIALSPILALSGLYPCSLAQPSSPADEYRTYFGYGLSAHAPSGGEDLVAAIRLRKRGQDYEVSGIIFVAGEIRSSVRGTFYPNSPKQLKATWGGQPDEHAAIDGTYDKSKDQFDIKTYYGEATLNRMDSPLILGLWKWTASGASGEFLVKKEDLKKGSFEGRFTGKTPEDAGSLTGDITGNQVVFKRSGTYKGKHFEQKWSGELTAGGVELRGNIQQGIPSPWHSPFSAQLIKDTL